MLVTYKFLDFDNDYICVSENFIAFISYICIMSVLVQKYNFDWWCKIRVCHIKGRMYAEGVQEQGTEEAAWTQLEGCNRSVVYYVMKSFIYCSSYQILQQNSFRLLTESINPDNSVLKREWFQDPNFGRL